MRAAVHRRFGGPEVVTVEQVVRPAPGPRDLLVRVRASTVSAADHRMRSRDLPKGLWILAPFVLGVFRPRKRVLGMDVAGVVDAVGADVTAFRPGDEVVASLGFVFGGHAEYVCVSADGVVAPAPRGTGPEDAVALVFGGLTALAFLRRAGLEEGDDVLVNGASGAVGSAAVQIAKHLGAQVTAVCSAAHRDLVTSLGADVVVDHTTEDFVAGGRTYDAVVECVGNAPFERVGTIVKDGGALLLVVADRKGLLGARRNSRRSGKLVTAADPESTAADLAHLVQLAEAGALRPVVDRVYDLAEVVEAHRYVDAGHKAGNVVLRVAGV